MYEICLKNLRRTKLTKTHHLGFGAKPIQKIAAFRKSNRLWVPVENEYLNLPYNERHVERAVV